MLNILPDLLLAVVSDLFLDVSEICGRMFQVCHWLLLQTVRCFKSKSTGYCLTFTTDLCFRSAPLAVLLDLPAGGCFRSAPVFCLRSTSACCLTGIYRWPLFQIYYWNANEDARTATMVELPLQTTEYVLTDLDESTLYAIRAVSYTHLTLPTTAEV